jgi:hypothetical protein
MKRSLVLAQSTAEYVIFLSLVVVAFTGIQAYFQRSLQGHIKFASDVLGEQKDWQQNDWKKGGTEYMSTVTSRYNEGEPKVELKRVDLGDEITIKRNQVIYTEGATNAKAMSEGF